MLFARFLQSSAALLVLTLGFAAPVHAQNNKQIISGTWFEDRAIVSSLNSAIVLTFAQTPTNQFLNVTNVSCFAAMLSDQVITAMNLFAGTTSGTSDLGRPYSIRGSNTPEIFNTSKYYSIVTNQIYYKFGPGRFPSIEMDMQSTSSFSTDLQCVIVGNLTDS